MDASGDEKPPALHHVLGPALSVCLSLSTISRLVLKLGREERRVTP